MSKSMSMPRPSSTVTAPFSIVRTVAIVGVDANDPRWLSGETTGMSSSASGRLSSSGARVGGVEDEDELMNLEAVGDEEDDDEFEVEAFVVATVEIVAAFGDGVTVCMADPLEALLRRAVSI
jgi:hypothetical protein